MEEKMICLENVSFDYGDRKILDQVSLEVSKGEKIGILGESGCGKSTLLSLLAGLYRPMGGTVTIAGATEPDEIVKKVSIVMQSPMLLPMTIYENITLGHTYPPERIDHALKVANLEKWIATLEQGIHTYLGDRAN